MKYLITAFLAIGLICGSFSGSDDLKPAQVLHQMFDSIRSVRTLRMHVSALERSGSKFISARSEIRLQSNPRKLYLLNQSRGLEILYNSELLHKRALVKQNVFPYVPVYLDPTGSLMRKNQHYTIHELGFDFIARSIALTISKDKDGLKNFVYHGKSTRNGYHCYMLEYENKNYSYTEYLVGENETASLIASRLRVNDYLLRHRNNLINDFGYLKKGSVLKIPTLYCNRAVLYIDDHSFLPVSASLYDDQGLFESYDFTKIQKNIHFPPDEFSKDYSDYGF